MPVHQSAGHAEQRLSLTPNGNVRYQLKTPYRDGTTHVIFEPLDFIARLTALVPKPPCLYSNVTAILQAQTTEVTGDGSK